MSEDYHAGASTPWRFNKASVRSGSASQGVTGDRFQRYEVSYWDLRYQKRRLLGRTDELEQADLLCRQIVAGRWMDLPEIRDREGMLAERNRERA